MLLAGMPAAIAAAMIAPVEVPATNEKVSRVRRPVVLSNLTKATAGMMPRMPPPSMLNRYRRGTPPPSEWTPAALAEDYSHPLLWWSSSPLAADTLLLIGFHHPYALLGSAQILHRSALRTPLGNNPVLLVAPCASPSAM